MNIENDIEIQYLELIKGGEINPKFADLYVTIEYPKLREILTGLHYNYIYLYGEMNKWLSTTNYFSADQSRKLISNIKITIDLYDALKDTKHAFEIDTYYFDLIKKCQDFLKTIRGSPLPLSMSKIKLYYKIPIFKPASTINVNNMFNNSTSSLKLIGSGSYANVYTYKDTFYNKKFALKRAKKELSEKEIWRFKREFDEMMEFSCPYISEVYCYNERNNEYVMEYMDFTLDEYISKNNGAICDSQRKGIVQQILKAFEYIHSKDRLHRDISPKNILLKKYEKVIVVKIADFGLIKIPDSSLTSVNTEFKGYFNDPSLIYDGFNKYNVLHEIYALTRIIYYVLTGKINTDNISNTKLKEFVQKGLNADKSLRFQTVDELIHAYRNLQ